MNQRIIENNAIKILNPTEITHRMINKQEMIHHISWGKGDEFIQLNGRFTLDELRALLFLIGNRIGE